MMKVFKFYDGEYYYAIAAKTKEQAVMPSKYDYRETLQAIIDELNTSLDIVEQELADEESEE